MEQNKRGIIYVWRYYTLEREDYIKCISKVLAHNLHGIRLMGTWFAVFMFLVSVTTAAQAVVASNAMVIELRDMVCVGIYLAVALGAVGFTLFAGHKYSQYNQGKAVSNSLIYALMILMYAAIMLTGIYMGVWASPDRQAVTFMVFLVCALFLVTASPVFKLSLTLGAIIAFAIASYYVKSFDCWTIDMMNLGAAAPIAVVLGWYTSMYRMSAALNAIKLEEERDNYQSQSTIDELTQIKNRRDFSRRFQRYLTNYREGDNFLCLAIVDIDFFKNYNDHHGHPKGDECLRLVGGALAEPWENPSVYAARIGGEEFALLWFEEDRSRAPETVALAQSRINTMEIPHPKSDAAPYVTVSMGVYVATCGAYDNTEIIYNYADSALYEAKGSGRNCAVIVDEGEKRHLAGP